ncbi:amidase [Roseinatronobacter monicus]|uniref:amidase n=1 Tax=Roseinatronobacter monicus TaxID=393481 RepID=UPI003F324449
MSQIPTIAEAASLLAAKSISPVELTQDCLERIRRMEPELHAFVTVTEERALSDARQAEAAIMKSGPRSKMHGIPIGLKDIVDTNGILTTCQSRFLADNIPDADATCAASLDAAGSILMGKLTTHEFADGGPSFDLPDPPARNPWNMDHFTAGSSSGTGAAVAAGLVLGGIGTDTGGSIRGPAALCGIAGLKPTYGLVSRAGVAPAAYSLDHIGPMCWTVEDCAIMLQSLAGHDPADPASANRPVPDYVSGIADGSKGLRIGVVRHFHETDHPVSAATQSSIAEAITIFEAAGATIVDVTLPSLQDWSACGFLISAAERLAAYEDWAMTRLDTFSERVRDRMFLGSFVTGSDYLQALRFRRELCAELAAVMCDVDILLTASNPGEAPLIDQVPRWDNLIKPNFTFPFNVAGVPALSLCGGFGPQGLPLGLQLVARPFEEALLMRAGHTYEMVTDWRSQRPAMISSKEPALA